MRLRTLALLCLLLLPTINPVVAAQDSSAAYVEDFDSLWEFVRDNYAYFDLKHTDWNRAREVFRPRAGTIRSRPEFIGLLEELLAQLYDPHANLGVNTASSPRLIPSGTDVWAEWRNGHAVITDVRAASDAERVGLRPGMEIRSIDGAPVAVATHERIPRTLRSADPAAEDWALRVALAGRRGAPVRLDAIVDGTERAFTFDPDLEHESGMLTSHVLPNEIGYVRIHNSLGELPLIASFDAALAELRNTRALVLDLRNTPSGGNTTVARGLMGRLIAEEHPYQRHELSAEERRYGVRRIWVEYVAPRGPFTYGKPIVVLVGRWTGSMGEGIAIGLAGMARATVVGTPMAGLFGATYQHTLPHTGFTANIPAERLYDIHGTPRDLFKPEVVVQPGNSREDRVLDEALRRLLR